MNLPPNEGCHEWRNESCRQSLDSTASVVPTRSVANGQICDLAGGSFVSRRAFVWGSMAFMLSCGIPVFAEDSGTATQPFRAQVKRLIDAMVFLGEPFTVADCVSLNSESMDAILPVLGRRCLFDISIRS